MKEIGIPLFGKTFSAFIKEVVELKDGSKLAVIFTEGDIRSELPVYGNKEVTTGIISKITPIAIVDKDFPEHGRPHIDVIYNSHSPEPSLA